MERFIYEFVVNPIGKLVKVEHTAEKFAHAAVWKSLTDDERNATSDIELLDVHSIPLLTPEQTRRAQQHYMAICATRRHGTAAMDWFFLGYAEGLKDSDVPKLSTKKLTA